jgi:hypothetical protein
MPASRSRPSIGVATNLPDAIITGARGITEGSHSSR